jgi:hypothetical protein
MIPERLPADHFTGNSLSCFLREVRVRLVAAQTIERTAPWFLGGAEGMACFYAVLGGGCRIRFEGMDESSSIGRGEIAVLLNGKKHWVQNDRQHDRRTVIFRGRFTWNSNDAAYVMAELPPMIRFKGENGEFVSWMARFVQMISDDSVFNRPGARAVMNQMAHVIFAQSILNVLQAQVGVCPRAAASVSGCYSPAKSDSRISSV